jgi:zinc/manganese transport system permease protein
VRELWAVSAVSSTFAFTAGFFGLLLSCHPDLPSGPLIVAIAGLAYCTSVLFGPHDSLRALYVQGRLPAARTPISVMAEDDRLT